MSEKMFVVSPRDFGVFIVVEKPISQEVEFMASILGQCRIIKREIPQTERPIQMLSGHNE